MRPLQGCSKERDSVLALRMVDNLLRRKRSQCDRASQLLPRKLPPKSVSLAAAITLTVAPHKVTYIYLSTYDDTKGKLSVFVTLLLRQICSFT